MRITRHKELVDAWVQMIRAWQYLPGHRLPTHRAFAAEHGVALATATKVYAELENLGLRDYHVGRTLWLVEWPERGEGHLPSPDLRLDFVPGVDVHRVEAVASSPAGEALRRNAPARDDDFFKVPKIIE